MDPKWLFDKGGGIPLPGHPEISDAGSNRVKHIARGKNRLVRLSSFIYLSVLGMQEISNHNRICLLKNGRKFSGFFYNLNLDLDSGPPKDFLLV